MFFFSYRLLIKNLTITKEFDSLILYIKPHTHTHKNQVHTHYSNKEMNAFYAENCEILREESSTSPSLPVSSRSTPKDKASLAFPYPLNTYYYPLGTTLSLCPIK